MLCINRVVGKDFNETYKLKNLRKRVGTLLIHLLLNSSWNME